MTSIAQAVDRAKAAGVAYFALAGNEGNHSWEGSYAPVPTRRVRARRRRTSTRGRASIPSQSRSGRCPRTAMRIVTLAVGGALGRARRPTSRSTSTTSRTASPTHLLHGGLEQPGVEASGRVARRSSRQRLCAFTFGIGDPSRRGDRHADPEVRRLHRRRVPRHDRAPHRRGRDRQRRGVPARGALTVAAHPVPDAGDRPSRSARAAPCAHYFDANGTPLIDARGAAEAGHRGT